MTIQGAIYELNNMLSSNDIPCYWKPVIKKIIETVEQTEQNVGMCQQNVGEISEKQTDGDLISRQAVNTLVDELARAISDERCCVSRGRATSSIMQDILDLPSVTPKPKTGHWIIKEGREQGYDIAGIKTWYIQIMCSKCGFIKTAIEGHTGQYHYCPLCGAKMIEPQESEEE